MVKTVVVLSGERPWPLGEVRSLIKVPPHTTLRAYWIDPGQAIGITVEIPDDGPDVKKADGL